MQLTELAADKIYDGSYDVLLPSPTCAVPSEPPISSGTSRLQPAAEMELIYFQ